jgi:hypothetical protein
MFGRAGPGCGEDHPERVQPPLEGLHPREPIVLAQRSCREVRSCLSLMWAVLDRAGRGWRGVDLRPANVRLLQRLGHQLTDRAHDGPQGGVAASIIPAA